MVIAVVPRGEGEAAAALMRGLGSLMNLVLAGSGTAKSEMLDLLGLADSRRDVVLSGVASARMAEVLSALRDGLRLDQPGRGIAFSVPMRSVAGRHSYDLLYRAFNGEEQ